MTIRSLGSRRGLVPLLAIAACLALPQAASADRWSHDRRAVEGRLVSVEVLVEGRWVPLHRAPGVHDRRYFAAASGENYAVRVRNRTGQRVGVLLSVDGLNVVDGERSSLSPREPMYVLDPYETTTIRGWRTSLDAVREFVFVDERRSYASRTGQANGDMGWIRVLAFEERRPVALRRHWPGLRDRGTHESEPRAGAASPPAASGKPEAQEKQTLGEDRARSESQHPGTGWGDRRRDPVQETWFEPVAHAADRIVLRYEYPDALADLGIHLDSDRLAERERGEWRFARPPRR